MSESPTEVPRIELWGGNKIPIIGIGTYLMEPKNIEQAITTALETGYRHIDAALGYGNEKEVGNALKKWLKNGGKREELFVATKLPPQANRASDVSAALDMSRHNLGLDYIDLYMIHKPFTLLRTPDFQLLEHEDGSLGIDCTTDLIAVWREMEKLVETGKVKSIGLSNFNATQVLKIWEAATIKPSALQIEANGYIQQDDLYKLCQKLGITVIAFSPLGSNGLNIISKKQADLNVSPLLDHPILREIAAKHNKTTAQVILRYNIQRNIVVIPKSVKPEKIRENFNVFDFTLTDDDMDRIKKINHGKYRKFDFLVYKGIESHPEYPFPDELPK